MRSSSYLRYLGLVKQANRFRGKFGDRVYVVFSTEQWAMLPVDRQEHIVRTLEEEIFKTASRTIDPVGVRMRDKVLPVLAATTTGVIFTAVIVLVVKAIIDEFED